VFDRFAFRPGRCLDQHGPWPSWLVPLAPVADSVISRAASRSDSDASDCSWRGESSETVDPISFPVPLPSPVGLRPKPSPAPLPGCLDVRW